jgi:hypothetical protein
MNDHSRDDHDVRDTEDSEPARYRPQIEAPQRSKPKRLVGERIEQGAQFARMLNRPARKPSTASLTPAITKIANAISIWLTRCPMTGRDDAVA